MSAEPTMWPASPPANAKGSNRIRRLVLLLSGAMASDLLLALILPGNVANLAYVVVLACLALILLLSGQEIAWHAGASYSLALSICSIASLLLNIDTDEIFQIGLYTSLLIMCFSFCFIFSQLFRTVHGGIYFFRSFSVMAAITLMIYFAVFSTDLLFSDERFGGIFNPNAIGLLSMSVGCIAMSLKLPARLPILSIALLGLYAANSRAAILSLVAGVSFVYILLWWRGVIVRKVLSIIVIGGILISFFFIEAINDFVVNEIFKYEDPYRGASTGFTNRIYAWSDAVNLWLAAPIVGYGYRAQELIFGDNSIYSSSHSGYLSLLIDGGALMLLVFCVFMVHSVWRSIMLVLVHPGLAGLLALQIGYLVDMLFERFALNFGNMASMAFAFASVSVFAISVSARHTGGTDGRAKSDPSRSGPLFRPCVREMA